MAPGRRARAARRTRCGWCRGGECFPHPRRRGGDVAADRVRQGPEDVAGAGGERLHGGVERRGQRPLEHDGHGQGQVQPRRAGPGARGRGDERHGVHECHDGPVLRRRDRGDGGGYGRERADGRGDGRDGVAGVADEPVGELDGARGYGGAAGGDVRPALVRGRAGPPQRDGLDGGPGRGRGHLGDARGGWSGTRPTGCRCARWARVRGPGRRARAGTP